jgi:DHA2 family multidrug resistance protein
MKPAPAQSPPRHPQLLLFTIFLLTAIEYLQSGMIAFGSGPIMGEIGAAPEEFSLISATYACVAIAAIAKQRWFAERLGVRRFVLLSLALFMIGAAVCGSSTTYLQFLAGRVCMAMGGGSLMTSARLLVNLIPPSPARFTGIKYFASALAVSSASAPWLASTAISHDGWRWIFIALIGIATVAVLLAAICLPADTSARELHSESHPVLLMVLIAGSFCVLYALQRSWYDFYGDATMLAGAGLVGVLALGYFARAMYRHDRVLLNIGALHNARYWSGVALFTFCYILMAATNYTLPALLQRGLGFPWEVIGQVQAVGLAATVVSWIFLSVLLPRKPAAKKYYLVGFLALSVFGWKIAHLSPAADLWTDFVPALACYGVFVMLVLATTAMHTFREVSHHETVFSHAQQIKNMLAQFGGSVGISLATISMQTRSAMHGAALSGHFAAGDPVYEQSLHQLTAAYAQSGALNPGALAGAGLAQMLGQQTTLLASLDYFWIVAGVGVTGALVMVAQRVLK